MACRLATSLTPNHHRRDGFGVPSDGDCVVPAVGSSELRRVRQQRPRQGLGDGGGTWPLRAFAAWPCRGRRSQLVGRRRLLSSAAASSVKPSGSRISAVMAACSADDSPGAALAGTRAVALNSALATSVSVSVSTVARAAAGPQDREGQLFPTDPRPAGRVSPRPVRSDPHGWLPCLSDPRLCSCRAPGTSQWRHRVPTRS